jgi:glycosyltransferase involved in cell wall biosynthesis
VRLLHVIEGLNPDRGGPPQVAAALASAQRDAGHEVAFASHDAGSAEVGDFLASRGLSDCLRVTVGACGVFGANSFAAAMDREPRPDALHLHGVWNPILPQAARWAERRGVPYRISTHGSLHPFPMRRARWKKELAMALTHRRLLRGASKVFVLNEEERRAAAPRCAPDAVEVLPNGVERRPEADRPHEGRSGRAFVVFLGRLDWTKGVERLVSAHRLVLDSGIDCDLVVVGNDWGSRASIESAIRSAGTGDRVRLVGPKYGDQKWELLASARLLVHLPHYEGFGMAVLEALAVGTPAVIGDRCLLPGAGPEMGVTVTASQPSALAAEVVRLLSDEGARNALAASGVRAARERFSWSAIAARCTGSDGPVGPRSGQSLTQASGGTGS